MCLSENIKLHQNIALNSSHTGCTCKMMPNIGKSIAVC